MGSRGQVFAHDTDRKRMKDLWPRIKRAKAHNIQVIDPADLATHDVLRQGVDCVMVDAPCTGTGTWRRHPDTKWRVTPNAFAQRLDEQRTVLIQGAKCVKPGGRLVYVTCSVLAEENENQIANFLTQAADFKALSHDELNHFIERKERPISLPSITTAGHATGALGLRMTPKSSETDGFFIACLERAVA